MPARRGHGNSRRQSGHQPHGVGINDVEVRISADRQRIAMLQVNAFPVKVKIGQFHETGIYVLKSYTP